MANWTVFKSLLFWNVALYQIQRRKNLSKWGQVRETEGDYSGESNSLSSFLRVQRRQEKKNKRTKKKKKEKKKNVPAFQSSPLALTLSFWVAGRPACLLDVCCISGRKLFTFAVHGMGSVRSTDHTQPCSAPLCSCSLPLSRHSLAISCCIMGWKLHHGTAAAGGRSMQVAEGDGQSYRVKLERVWESVGAQIYNSQTDSQLKATPKGWKNCKSLGTSLHWKIINENILWGKSNACFQRKHQRLFSNMFSSNTTNLCLTAATQGLSLLFAFLCIFTYLFISFFWLRLN